MGAVRRVAAERRRQARVLRFWRAVEYFSPPKVDPVNPRKNLFAVGADRPLPWEPGSPLGRVRSRPGLVWQHTVYAGIFGVDKVRDVLLEAFRAPESERDLDGRTGGDSAVLCFTVNQDGMLIKDSATLSSCAWAVGRTLAPGPGDDEWLTGFDECGALLLRRLLDLGDGKVGVDRRPASGAGTAGTGAGPGAAGEGLGPVAGLMSRLVVSAAKGGLGVAAGAVGAGLGPVAGPMAATAIEEVGGELIDSAAARLTARTPADGTVPGRTPGGGAASDRAQAPGRTPADGTSFDRTRADGTAPDPGPDGGGARPDGGGAPSDGGGAPEEGAEPEGPPPEVGTKVLDVFDLAAITRWTAEQLGIAGALTPDAIRIKSYQVSARNADETGGDVFLNSFYADDLERIAGVVESGGAGTALLDYLCSEDGLDVGERLDVRRRPEAVLEGVRPSDMPLGRWPADTDKPLVLSQQFAVNRILADLGQDGGLYAVNGPPGTGKTTMLRDLIAALVVQRAERLAELRRPEDAFAAKPHTWRTEETAGKTYPRTIHPLIPELTGFEIVIASSNNGAVENVALEVPGAHAIGGAWRGRADYLAGPASLVLGEDAWGAIAARLGRRGNRSDFVQRFWWGERPKGGGGAQPEAGSDGPLLGLHQLLRMQGDHLSAASRTAGSTNPGAPGPSARTPGVRASGTGASGARASGTRAPGAGRPGAGPPAATPSGTTAPGSGRPATGSPGTTPSGTAAAPGAGEAPPLGSGTWGQAVRRFTRARDRVRALAGERQEIADLRDRLAGPDPRLDELLAREAAARDAVLLLQREQRRAEAELAGLRDEHARCQEALSAERARLDGAEAAVRGGEEDVGSAERVLRAHDAARPGLFGRLFAREAAGRWESGRLSLSTDVEAARARLTGLRSSREARHAALGAARGELERALDALERVRGRLADGERARARRAAAVTEAGRQVDLRRREAEAERHRLAAARERWGDRVPGAEWLAEPDDRPAMEVREQSAPWMDDEFAGARSELFLAALDLHRALLATAPDRMRRSLQAVMEVVKGQVPADLDDETVLAAWQLLFLVVPAVSTTFASMGRMFSRLGGEALGWLFVDEAGQAAPQEVVGALWRARRAVVVGDPLQLEPVVTLPWTGQRRLAGHFGVDRLWAPAAASVQSLADRVTPYGTWLEDQEGEEIWLGSPLRVHRRCDRLMFDVSNRIAYDGMMVYGVHRDQDDFPLAQRSVWWDVPALPGEEKWNPGEGRALEATLDRIRARVDEALRRERPPTGEPLPGAAPGELPEDDPGHAAALDRRLNDAVFVISPFRDVVHGLGRVVGGTLAARRYGTVHTTQGKEADIVILVLGTGAGQVGSRNWAAQKPNLLNVAVTRARRRLIVIGDFDVWSKHRYFGDLARHELIQRWSPER
ncbi:AAA domain-containing protein [Streptomyces sp. SHP 1-2]|uniref:AAA domain-containing protein n=1 Tax=Streptomyces sp. SHP 1-2 TaxID=2769489 RepID=UPI0022388FC1|nr:AAA domain-containing protein [Streptomyces sp. SHP 1-2]MCW5253310.1 ATP-binding domain-containing protein [Streptomyces sp. SHP 1-2]